MKFSDGRVLTGTTDYRDLVLRDTPHQRDRRHVADPFAVGPVEMLLDLINEARPAWHALAACRGVGIAKFFPVREGGPSAAGTAAIKREFCARCPVRADCLAAGLDQGASRDHGIWGGTSVRDRRRIRRQRRERAA